MLEALLSQKAAFDSPYRLFPPLRGEPRRMPVPPAADDPPGPPAAPCRPAGRRWEQCSIMWNASQVSPRGLGRFYYCPPFVAVIPKGDALPIVLFSGVFTGVVRISNELRDDLEMSRRIPRSFRMRKFPAQMSRSENFEVAPPFGIATSRGYRRAGVARVLGRDRARSGGAAKRRRVVATNRPMGPLASTILMWALPVATVNGLVCD